MRIHPVITGTGLAAAALVLGASPAAADAPAPGDYTSEVTSVEPAVDGLAVEVVGGDAFLSLEVPDGVEVVVLGYDEEPFLRFLDDGTVEQNLSSPATYLNDDRYAEVDVPERLVGVDAADLDPEWEQVGSDGTYAWHDHRIHWMAPNAPPAIARGGTFDWSAPVPLLVDGERVEVTGAIRYEEAVSPLPWLLGGVVLAVGAALALRGRTRAGAGLAAVVAVGAAAVAWATWSAAPEEAGASALPVVVAVVAAVLGLAAVLAPARFRTVLVLAVAAILGTWGALRFAVLTNPVLPTDLPFAVDRAVTVAAIAAALAVAASALTAPPASARGSLHR